MEMDQQKGYTLFYAANSNTPSTPIQQHEGQSIPRVHQVREANIDVQKQHMIEKLRMEFKEIYEEIRVEMHKILKDEHDARDAKFGLRREDDDRFRGVANLFDDSRDVVICTKYGAIPCFLPCDFFALFGDDADAEIFSTLEEKVEKTSRDMDMDNFKEEEQGIVYKVIFFGSLRSGVMVPYEKKVSNEGMVDDMLPGKVGIVQATYVEPRETELLEGDAFVASKDEDANFVEMLKQGEYRDPFLLDLLGTDNGLLKVKLLFLLRKTLLQGMDVGTLIVSGCLMILLKASCDKGRVRGRVSCVAASWDLGGLCSGLQGFEEWCYVVAGSNFETKFSKRRMM